MAEPLKRCSKCQSEHPLAAFNRNSRSKDGLHGWCRVCVKAARRHDPEKNREQSRRWAQENSEKVLAMNKRWRKANAKYLREYHNERYSRTGWAAKVRRYGLTLDRFEGMLRAQGGVCALCDQAPANGARLVVDHDHSCCPSLPACGGCVRGLLCSNCNVGLGMFGDNPERLLRAARFLSGEVDN